LGEPSPPLPIAFAMQASLDLGRLGIGLRWSLIAVWRRSFRDNFVFNRWIGCVKWRPSSKRLGKICFREGRRDSHAASYGRWCRRRFCAELGGYDKKTAQIVALRPVS
jgi:hypothetical protein